MFICLSHSDVCQVAFWGDYSPDGDTETQFISILFHCHLKYLASKISEKGET